MRLERGNSKAVIKMIRTALKILCKRNIESTREKTLALFSGRLAASRGDEKEMV
jgi:hypothetical protein